MKKTIFKFGLFLLAVLLPTGCSSDKEDYKIAEELLNQTTCEFNTIDLENFRFNAQRVISQNGTWIIKTTRGVITSIDFGENPSPIAPTSPEAFFEEVLKKPDDITYILKDKTGNKISYLQYYKDLPVCYIGFVDEPLGYTFICQEDGSLESLYGEYLPIKDMNVLPAYSEKDALVIAKNCIKNNLNENYQFNALQFQETKLVIAACPHEGKYSPQLAYYCYATCPHSDDRTAGVCCYIDAQSGILLTLGIYL